MSSEEPPTKKQRSSEDWENHTLNIGQALMKASEGKNFSEIVDMDIDVLQGIGPKSEKVLDAMGVKTVKDLAGYKFYLLARAIKVLSETEEKRPAGSFMNIDHAMDKAFESKSLTELLEAPLSAFEGLTPKADEVLKELRVKTIGDLADFKFCKWAEAICELAKYEETKTKEERHLEKELKKLS